MAFLRLNSGRIRERRHKSRMAAIEVERDEWLQERKRPQRAKLVGRSFATSKRAAEYVFRAGNGKLKDGPAREARSFRARGKASMAVNKPSQGALACFRVRPINGIWRRYVQAKHGWRYVSDHASEADALAGRNAIPDPEYDRSGKVAWQKIEG